jgi:membrane-bound lytic murein transglycosylase B
MMSSLWKAGLASVALIIASGYAHAQTAQSPAGMHSAMPQHMSADMEAMHAQMMTERAGKAGQPTMPGQDAFGAIQEIVRILEADPNTDWSKVNLEALRQHLIDMNEVTLKADAASKQIDGGLEIAVTGAAATLAAIQRMVPAHAQEINGLHGWSVKAAALPNGELLTVTAADPKEVQHIRGLGFIGILVSGMHHQPHHLMMAKGEFVHAH